MASAASASNAHAAFDPPPPPPPPLPPPPKEANARGSEGSLLALPPPPLGSPEAASQRTLEVEATAGATGASSASSPDRRPSMVLPASAAMAKPLPDLRSSPTTSDLAGRSSSSPNGLNAVARCFLNAASSSQSCFRAAAAATAAAAPPPRPPPRAPRLRSARATRSRKCKCASSSMRWPRRWSVIHSCSSRAAMAADSRPSNAAVSARNSVTNFCCRPTRSSAMLRWASSICTFSACLLSMRKASSRNFS
mmetsp:Transcript_62909/g.159643  ORF Transcript_62909/g.159643 Transcript_62909/m.159643 type:complete len:251 (+) Transcript_62909:171-923(+)